IALVFARATSAAPPTITKLSLRGLQTGATTTLAVEGENLLPNPHVLLDVPVKSESAKQGGKPNRVEFEIALDEAKVESPGIYLFRLATDDGVSNAIPLGIDRLPQVPFAAEILALPVALHGELSGNQVLRTTFSGKKDQEIVIEIEAKRYGAAF